MDKQWDNYFALTEEDAAAVTKEVWITTPGGERPLPLGFAACRAGGDVAEAVALQKALILWCAEGLHPKLAPFLRGKAQGSKRERNSQLRRLISGRFPLGLEALMLFLERPRAEHSR
jgi:hypothetical protein